jgi:hypothetical protein
MKPHIYGSLSHLPSDIEAESNLNEFQKLSNEKKDSLSKYLTVMNILGTVAVGLVMICASVFSSTREYVGTVLNTETYSGLSITVSNEYGTSSSDKYPYSFLKDSLFAETYKNNQFKVNNAVEGCSYDYSIASERDETFSYQGTAVDGAFYFEPKTPGQYSLTVNELCGDSITKTVSSSVWSKYVRRELTSLTDADREEFLDTFATLWKVNTVDGQKLYGEKYKSVHYFAVVHNDAGGSPACDEFHGDSGFMSNHVMLTAHLEQSLRAINPKVSLHYMEYYKYFSFGDYDSRKFPLPLPLMLLSSDTASL